MGKVAQVYIQGRAYYNDTARTFRDLGGGNYKICTRLPDSDIVVWTGGDDVCPAIYDENPIHGTTFSRARDLEDLEAIKESVGLGKFLVGICRGAQLLNVVPNGGKLWQDVDGHGHEHRTFDCVSGQWLTTNSVHHQMMRPGPDAELVAWAQSSTRRKAESELWQKPRYADGATVLEKDKDPEALWYPKTNSLLVQFHPEFGHPETTRYFFRLMNNYYWGKFNTEAKAA